MTREINTPVPTPEAVELRDRLDRFEPRQFHEEGPVVWEGGRDEYVWDAEHNVYLDFTSGIFVASVGHNNAAVEEAIWHAPMLHAYGYPTQIRAQYLERLTKWCGYEQAILHSSGTEAVECAIKLMRLNGRKEWVPKRRILACSGAFHGRTMGAELLRTEGKAKLSARWCGVDNMGLIPFPYPWEVEGDGSGWFMGSSAFQGAEFVCGVMLEAFQGWCCAMYPQGFINDLVGWCKRYDIPICVDEMQSGFGRTGRGFMFEHYGFKPDLICVGKAMGGGYPLSGVLGSREMLNPNDPGDLSSTHSGNPAACAAGLAVLNEIQERGLVDEAARKGELLMPALGRIRSPHIVRVNGKGLIAAIMFDSEPFATAVVHACLRKGLLVVHTGRESIKIAPPLVIADEALIEGVSVIKEAIAECSTQPGGT